MEQIVKRGKKKILVINPKINLKNSKPNSAKRAEDILRIIRGRQVTVKPEWETEKRYGIWHGFPERAPVRNKPMTADAWQTFKKDFIDEYGGEKVKETGLTDSEFLEWFKEGKRELHHEPGKLETLLAELNAHGTAVKHNNKTRKKNPKKGARRRAQ